MKSYSGEDELHRYALSATLEPLAWPLVTRHGIEVMVRRDDQLDHELSGNKFYKLFFNLQAARAAGVTTIASYGGAWSNHLHALAAAGRRYGLKTVGIVRGDQPATLSPTLADASAYGMTLIFQPRSRYQQETRGLNNRAGTASALRAQLGNEFGDIWVIPEGGANTEGARGAQAIGHAIEQQLQGEYQQVCIPCGTGTSLAGVAAGLPADKVAVGFSVLKGAGDLGANVAQTYRALSARPRHNWRLISGYHGGGYGRKLPDNLRRFWREFELQTKLQLDPVYTLKMFWGIAQLAQQHYWQQGTRLVVIHTGGLQGRRGFHQQIDW